jgi:acyl carrier protein
LHNEMSMFRYDVCIDLGSSSHPCVDSDFESLMAPEAIGDVVNYLDQKKQGFVLRDIVNPRVAAHLWVFEQRHAHDDVTRVTDLHEALSKERLGGIDPEQLYQLQTPWCVELTWPKSGAAECYDAYFTPVDEQFGINMALHDSAKVMSEYAFEPIPQIDSFVLVERLKTVLSNTLPEFMVPEEFVVLESLPLTPNGKIDRKALPKPDKRQRVVEVDFVAPEGDIEQTIAAVLQEMLNLEKIGTRDNFSDLGANSLLMVQANSHLSRQLGRKVPLVSMYRYPTVVSLAEYLSGDVDGTEGLEKGQQRGEKRKQAQKRNSKRRLSNRKAN